MYAAGTPGYQNALASYTLIPNMACFTKTEWNRAAVLEHTGVACDLVGASVDLDLFRPRPSRARRGSNEPVRIGAMVRVYSPYRAPKLTMQVLQEAYLHYGPGIEIMVFGSDPTDPGFADLPTRFPWKMAGLLSTRQVASYMNEIDIFADFSSHQAMGLSAMEAMACGVAVIVPSKGGASSYAVHGENALIIDTSTFASCFKALRQLVDDRELRTKIQHNAVVRASQFFPEKPALEILKSIFKDA